MIEIKNLSKTYKTAGGAVQALRGISLRIEAGEIFGIAGFSGAGKSTLLRCLNRLERADEGSIHINGDAIRDLSSRELARARRKIGMIFQHFNLLDSRDVAGNIAFPLEIAGLDAAAIQERVRELAQWVGIEDKLQMRPFQLSGGQKQRVGIARAIALNPSVLLCDEATSALDPPTALQILELLRSLNQRLGLTVVMVTHQLEVIRNYCERVALLDQGQLVELGRTRDVFLAPSSESGRRLIEVGMKLFSGEAAP